MLHFSHVRVVKGEHLDLRFPVHVDLASLVEDKFGVRLSAEPGPGELQPTVGADNLHLGEAVAEVEADRVRGHPALAETHHAADGGLCRLAGSYLSGSEYLVWLLAQHPPRHVGGVAAHVPNDPAARL